MALILWVVALPGHAACVDWGSPRFAESLNRVTLCDGAGCGLTLAYRDCGTNQSESQEMVTDRALWTFEARYDDQVARYSVRQSRLVPVEVPSLSGLQTVLDRALPPMILDQARARQIMCNPVADVAACDFINEVLAGVQAD